MHEKLQLGSHQPPPLLQKSGEFLVALLLEQL
jgi:hypothetical protein